MFIHCNSYSSRMHVNSKRRPLKVLIESRMIFHPTAMDGLFFASCRAGRPSEAEGCAAIGSVRPTALGSVSDQTA